MLENTSPDCLRCGFVVILNVQIKNVLKHDRNRVVVVGDVKVM